MLLYKFLIFGKYFSTIKQDDKKYFRFKVKLSEIENFENYLSN